MLYMKYVKKKNMYTAWKYAGCNILTGDGSERCFCLGLQSKICLLTAHKNILATQVEGFASLQDGCPDCPSQVSAPVP
jgi:hypothetical protein